MSDIANIEAWAITQGYDPSKGYAAQPDIDNMPDGYLSPHFKIDEFRCHHCGKLHPDGVPLELLKVLEDVRAQFGGRAVTINSGYRSPKHNADVGGVPDSQHVDGTAADIVVSGIPPAGGLTPLRAPFFWGMCDEWA